MVEGLGRAASLGLLEGRGRSDPKLDQGDCAQGATLGELVMLGGVRLMFSCAAQFSWGQSAVFI